MGKQDRTLVPTAAEVTPVIIKRANLKGQEPQGPKKPKRGFSTQKKL